MKPEGDVICNINFGQSWNKDWKMSSFFVFYIKLESLSLSTRIAIERISKSPLPIPFCIKPRIVLY